MNISETSGPIAIKFYLNHHWGGGKAALGFGPDRIRTLVSMAIDSSHRVKWGKSCDHSRAYIFYWIFFIFAGNKDSHKISNKLSQIGPRAVELAALERLEKSP